MRIETFKSRRFPGRWVALVRAVTRNSPSDHDTVFCAFFSTKRENVVLDAETWRNRQCPQEDMPCTNPNLHRP